MKDLGLGVLVGILLGTVAMSLALALSDVPKARAAGGLNLIYQLNLAVGPFGGSA
ncbi:hypothetical protein Nocox_03435 [Nonomuraea coxensis DSM 45129]|uniref:Uncharacterized protein n=1 Tax=Nonomuraea coxensis DSM 45129 TaxID=1122611 RepID=A0ABX8TS62_9ACTN|nr:hypothetical protein [Nonomuraea coxensis]QYC38316.1 hypothetical protein Nocox_03435 [Nonomuraea coxensis DSM 45129]